MKAKILKGAEENQVEMNVIRITVVASSSCDEVSKHVIYQ